MDNLKRKDNVNEGENSKLPSEAERRGDFRNFNISETSVRTLKKTGINYLFPIQVETFNHISNGKDLIGRDRTGSGKTLAFALPILERLRNGKESFVNKRGQRPYILCLVPTRELAIQVTREFERFKNFDNEYRVLSIYGGTDIGLQLDALRDGVEVVIGTPGRVIDLLERRALSTSDLKHMILDETDQMLNIGFQEDIERILKYINNEFDEMRKSIETIQFLLFSATIPKWIEKMSSKFMKRDLVFVDMIKHSEVKTSKTVEHLSIFIPSKELKIPAIGDIVLVYGGTHSRTIIFTDKKEEANEVMLHGQLKVESQVLHGDIPQAQREVTFKSFRNGNLKCLIATNVAARGLDIPEVDLIIQLSPPSDVETYIHRSGRTGRAGKSGTCVTFFTKKQQELMDKIEFKARIKFRKIGAPQPSDIMRATARDVAYSLDNVSKDVLTHFSENAKEILERYSPEEALSRAIAIISGYTQSVKQRSLICSVEGLITYLMEIDQEARSISFFWNILKKNYAPTIVDSVKSMRLLKNHKGVVFDLKEEHKDNFEEIAETLKRYNIIISQAKELPEFEDRGDFSGPAFFNSNVQGNGFQPTGSYRTDNSKGFYRGENNGFSRNDNGFSRNEYKANGFSRGENQSNGFNRNDNYPSSSGTTGFPHSENKVGFFRSDNKPGMFRSDRNSDQQRPENSNGFHRGDGNNRGNDYSEGIHRSNNFTQGSTEPNPNKDDTKLFVSNLSYDIDEKQFQELMQQKGLNALDFYLVKNQDKTSKGFGYVKFSDANEARLAFNELRSMKVSGRQIRVDYADKKN